jgi:hypothetical protein
MRIVFDQCSVHEIHPVGTAARLIATAKRANGRNSKSRDELRRSVADIGAGRIRTTRRAVALPDKNK